MKPLLPLLARKGNFGTWDRFGTTATTRET
jgi:hypothetical protein